LRAAWFLAASPTSLSSPVRAYHRTTRDSSATARNMTTPTRDLHAHVALASAACTSESAGAQHAASLHQHLGVECLSLRQSSEHCPLVAARHRASVSVSVSVSVCVCLSVSVWVGGCLCLSVSVSVSVSVYVSLSLCLCVGLCLGLGLGLYLSLFVCVCACVTVESDI
jgi:hypothetical protein